MKIYLFEINFQRDERHIHEFQDHPHTYISTSINPSFGWWRLLFEMMAFTYEGHASLTVEFLRFCAETTGSVGSPEPVSFAVEPRDQENPYGVDLRSLEWVQISSSDQCDALFSIFKNQYGNGDSFKEHRGIEIIKSLRRILRTFENRSYPLTEIETDCLTRIEDAVNALTLYEETLNIGIKIVESPDVSTALSFAEELLPLYGRFVTPAQVNASKIDDDLINSCSWLESLGNKEGPRVEQDRIEMLEAYSFALETKTHFNSIRRIFNKIFNKVAENNKPIVSMTNRFLNGSATKLEVSLMIDTNIFVKALEDIVDKNNELRENINDFEHSMTVGKEKLHNAYANLTTMQIAFLNT